jgi:hypothetical protein
MENNVVVEPQRLVMIYHVTDGHTYGYDVVQPLMYASTEAALVDFEELVKKAGETEEIFFAGKRYPVHLFIEEGEFCAPEFLTVDEWFALNVPKATAVCKTSLWPTLTPN